MKPVTVVIFARGHANVQAKHTTTFEITKEAILTKNGDCVIAVEAISGTAELPLEFKEAARKNGAKITIAIEAGELKEMAKADGSPQLLFMHPTDLVVRKSDYICGRTLAINADKAASDLSRKIVEKLKDPNQVIRIILTVESY